MKINRENKTLTQMTDLKKDEEGIIAELNTDNPNILRKLMAMGIMPGMNLKMIQTFPSYVFQVGYTQVAVDKEIASVIIIDKQMMK
ncbi:ferrous iron transport protein A [Proteiniborus ethanoligenes]|uniref:Ferrous iron transport protein A n=1 Tax=Proteiniborus ethanoligenes TaxID=415015 RepID=A0A1H3SQW4_9FIRM|nr:FeoA family protein [Proteiniborus ethanoligenes]TAH62687.1 MAG: ferrous iron transport protein A [Gottschalkiaceae bacterium]SDZ39941.1 ferrous iron transport protein A [Proteiniborus ethanoligenes]